MPLCSTPASPATAWWATVGGYVEGMDGGQEAFLSAEVRLLTRRITVSGRTAVQTVLSIFHDQAVRMFVVCM